MKFRTALQLLVACTLVVSSCSKDEDPPAATPSGGSNTSTPNTTPSFPGSDGSLWAINTVSLQSIPQVGTFEVELGTGVAVFTDDNYVSFMDAGAVTLNTAVLTKNSNNSYVFIPSISNPTGISFTAGMVDWDVAGSGSVSGFTQSVSSIPFPSVDTISSGTTIDLSAGYTLSTASITGADSVIFMVGSVLKTLAGSATSCNFSASELSSLSAGQSVAQIAAYSYTSQAISGKTYYFGKEEVQTRTVTLQ